MIKQIYGVGVTPVHGTTVHGCAKVDGVCDCLLSLFEKIECTY